MCNLVHYLTEGAVAENVFISVMRTSGWENGMPEPVLY